MSHFIFAVVLMITLHPLPAFAYIDPASGSAILSAIIGIVVALALAAKTYWYKILALFNRRNPGECNDDPGPPRQ